MDTSYLSLKSSVDEYLIREPGEELSADDIVNIRKEPIVIDLEVQENRRTVKPAVVRNLTRTIVIPKNEMDHLYSVCEPESLHVKTLDEIHSERQVQEQLTLEKIKYDSLAVCDIHCVSPKLELLNTSVEMKQEAVVYELHTSSISSDDEIIIWDDEIDQDGNTEM